MSLPLLHLPVEVVEQIVACLNKDSKRSLALALGGRPRPGDCASEQHVRDLQRLLLPTKILLDIDDEDRSPDILPESESGAAARDLAHAQIRRHSSAAVVHTARAQGSSHLSCQLVMGMAAHWWAWCHSSQPAGPAGVRLQTTHLHICCPLIDADMDDEDEGPRADVLAVVERLAMIMSLQWPEVVEVRGPAERSLPLPLPHAIAMSRWWAHGLHARRACPH
jgi:hypothetical protein